MPNLIRPELPQEVEVATGFMGSRAQTEILRQLSLLGRATIGQIQAVTRISRPSLNRHLSGLSKAGLVLTDPPEGLRHGKDVTYAVQRARIHELAQGYLSYVEGA